MKRIVTVQDISCVGKCSLTVALPIISCMGTEAAVVPTAVLSTHTAFKKGWTFRDLTQDMQPIFEHWKKENIGFDAIYTGYLGSFEQLDIMQKMFFDFGKNALIFVDPCMADNGCLYAGFTQEFAFSMAKLCAKADVIVPNITEASYMLGVPYKANGYNEDYIIDMLHKLADLGAKSVVLKGIEFSGPQKTFGDVAGKIGIASLEGKTGKITSYFHEKLPISFHGTGDIFASVCVGALMKDFSLQKAYSLAADYVVECIKQTINHKNYNWYGVDFEACVPYLVKRLEN